MSGSSVRIERVDPVKHADAVKRFFVEEGGEEFSDFPSYFDRTFPEAVDRGGKSWIGLDGSGRIILHWACLPIRLRWNSTVLRGGLMANLMAARDHRNFFSAYRLVTKVVGDLRSESDLDLLYGSPNDAGLAVTLKAGFENVGGYGRHVLPVSDPSRPALDGLLWAYTHVHKALRGRRGTKVRRESADAVPVERFERPPETTPRTIVAFRPRHSYRRRLDDFPGEGQTWYVVERDGNGEALAHALVANFGGKGDYLSLVALFTAEGIGASAALVSITRALRQDGCRRIQAWAVEGSSREDELGRAGFRSRDQDSLIVLPLSDTGTEAVGRTSRWELGWLDVDF